ncbi:interferon-induced transmembrane protein 5 [Pelodiscus sinensis]|uniref:Interferon induced transmembrane protein 5 n=1 Tax=Pelodiscus sinensis TaxID=13735 RepID=K7FRB8_PELSI|nr:interferon-induced transmembrane protein 5 [Pelodiscus sinensis]|eukprot:XP_006131718.1 interferon-induced transmembrane protein 5 [Pelodiscus sinensis]
MDTSYPREDFLPMTSRKQDPSSTAITIGPSVVPRDHLIWSIFNTIYMNLCCFGLVALAYSVKARDRKVTGDVETARYFSSRAKCCNILATVWSLLLPLLLLALAITGVIHLSKLAQESMDFFNYKIFAYEDDRK